MVIGFWLPQCVDMVDWALVRGIICCLLYCMVLKCVVYNDGWHHCTVVVLESVVFLSLVLLVHVVLIVEVFSWLCVGMYVVVFSFILTLTVSHSWFQVNCVVVYDLWLSWKQWWVCFWASWMCLWRGNDCIFCVVGRTDCWHWGVLVIHDRMFIIWLGVWNVQVLWSCQLILYLIEIVHL